MCDIENHIKQVRDHPEMFTQTEENIVEEIVRLRELVKEAYEKGFQVALYPGPFLSCKTNWENSKFYKILEQGL